MHDNSMSTTSKGKQIGTRKGHEVSVKAWEHPNYNWRADYVENGKYKRKGFKTKDKAEEWAENRAKESLAHGTDSALTASERSTVADTRAELEEVKLDLREAVAIAVEQRRREMRSCTMRELADRMISTREDEGLSDHHIRDMRGKLKRFNKEFGDRPVATITKREVEDWLHALKLAPASVNSYCRILVVAFNDAIGDGFADENPAAKIRDSKVVEGEVGILTPAESSALLVGADPAIVPVIALGLFSGLRVSELERLDWSEVLLEEGQIQVKASKAKSARNRLVPIPDNLSAWLAPYVKNSGAVWPANGRRLMGAAHNAAGFGTGAEVKEAEAKAKEEGGEVALKKWPDNALRHSYATYHLAHHQNMAALALHLGHTTSALIFAHYRKPVTPQIAATYWSIAPAKASNIIQLKKSRKAKANG